MRIINYSINIELTMTRSLRFPYGCDMRRADDFFVNRRYSSTNATEQICYSNAISILRQAKNYGASLNCISSELINKEHICRFSFSFNKLEDLQKFISTVNSNQKRDVI